MSVQESCWNQRQPGGLPAGWYAAVPTGSWTGKSDLAWSYMPSFPLHQSVRWPGAWSLPLFLEKSVRKIVDLALENRGSANKCTQGMGQIELLQLFIRVWNWRVYPNLQVFRDRVNNVAMKKINITSNFMFAYLEIFYKISLVAREGSFTMRLIPQKTWVWELLKTEWNAFISNNCLLTHD